MSIIISQQRSQCEKKDVIMGEMKIAFGKQLNSRQLEVRTCVYIHTLEYVSFVYISMYIYTI